MAQAKPTPVRGDLATEFNATVDAYLRQDVSSALLLTKFNLLMRHIADSPAQRTQIAGGLYRCIVGNLEGLASAAGPKAGSADAENFKTQINHLLAPATAEFVPPGARAQLAGLSLDLLRRAETLGGWEQTYMVNLADAVLGVADKMAEAQPEPAAAPKKKEEQLAL
jgi:hypothetical protein